MTLGEPCCCSGAQWCQCNPFKDPRTVQVDLTPGPNTAAVKFIPAMPLLWSDEGDDN